MSSRSGQARALRAHAAGATGDRNWNNALAAAEGEYLIMLGDDDALLSNYFATIRRLVATFSQPDVIYHSAMLYAFPSVLPDAPEGT